MKRTASRFSFGLTLLTVLGLMAPRPAAAQGTLLWQHNLNGNANSDDRALSVALDSLGNVVAAGYSTNTDTGPNFTVAKFAPDGTFLWQQSRSGTASQFDRAFMVAVDTL